MATILKLKSDIKKLKGALTSKGLSASIKTKLKNQLDKAQNELASMQKGGKPRKVSTTKGTKSALANLKELVKKKKYGIYKGAGVDLKKDAEEPALPIGRRVSKGLKGNQYGGKKASKGNVYYEYRANRLDVKQPSKSARHPKLEEGGQLEWANDENEKLGKWLLGSPKGHKVLKASNNSVELEKNVRKYAEENGGEVARLSIYDEDGGLEWVTFDDLWKEIQLKKKFAKGGYMAKGGVTEKEVVESNAQMVLSQIKAVKHHAEELENVVNHNSEIEAWVVGKIERASTDLSDITHYLEGRHEKMSMGGSIRHYTHKMDKK